MVNSPPPVAPETFKKDHFDLTSPLESAGENNKSHKWSLNKGSIVGYFLLVIVIISAIFYALNGKPLFSIEQTSISQSPTLQVDPNPTLIIEPAFIILGESKNRIYTFNEGTKRVYAYDLTNQQESEICNLKELDSHTFQWHASGKMLFISYVHDAFGGLYALDLITNTPQLKLLTNRNADIYFPPNLQLDPGLPMSWSARGDAVAFVAQDAQTHSESLFIYEWTSNRLVYTPARNIDHISNVLWTEGDTLLSLIAINNGQEERYFVDRNGGGFIPWQIAD